MISMQQIVQMGPMLVLAGLAIGWIAETAWTPRGYGLLIDMILGVAGSLLGGVVFWIAISSHIGMIAMFAIGSAGGALAIFAQRGWWTKVRSLRLDVVASHAR
jgi:uncharacterized membrane protein YeaQ/YmgE (transglycosylase-associated protein family)